MADEDDTYDPNTDWVPPKQVYMDDLLIVDPVLGKVPFWKSLIYNSAMLRNAVERRNDSAPHDDQPMTTALGPEEGKEPPALAADESTSSRATLSDEDLERINKAVDALDQRLTQLEARRDAERKLEELEDALEATGIAPDDEGTIKLHS
jgi:hypothetical protein